MSEHHLPVLINDLAIILMAAGITTILFRWLKQPVALGYVAAGVIVGPHIEFTATVSDVENVRVWGEIGVIFVLFGLGLEFSFRKLMRVGGPGAFTAMVETSLLLAMGSLAGLLMGWSPMDSLFLGGLLSISSTMIITKIYEEMGLKNRSFAQLVLGILIFEDLVAVLLLVLLSTVAVTRTLVGSELAFATLRLGFFLILWFVVGLFILPGLLRSVRKLLSPETTLIFSVGLCLMMVLIANEAGFSPALGAFVMGSLLAETDEGHRIEEVLHPLRNFFGAVFFVSVGMLFDPKMLLELWPAILAITVVLIIGKTVAVTAGALMTGQNLKTGVRAGLSMTQIGEFSFIIASLGLTLGVVSDRLYPIAVGVSLISSVLTPVWLRRSDQIVAVVERWLPKRFISAIDRYQSVVQANQGTDVSMSVIRAYGPLIIVNLVLILATTWVSRVLILPKIEYVLGASSLTRVLGLMLDMLLCLPFFYGMCLRRPSKKWREKSRQYPRIRWIEMGLAGLRVLLGMLLFLIVTAQYLSWKTLSGLTLTVFLIMAFMFYSYGGKIYRKLEKRFLGQLNKGEHGDDEKIPQLLPWDTHLTELTVTPESSAAGLTIERLGLQESFGIMIAAIDRGQKRILAPRGSDVIFPGDRISVIGSDSDIERLRRLVETTEVEHEEASPLQLQSVVLANESVLCGKTVRESGIRDLVEGLLVGLERQGYRQLNPSPDLRLESGDRLWIVGDPGKMNRLNA